MKKSIGALTLGAIAIASNPSIGESPYFSSPKKGPAGKPALTNKQKKVRAKNKAAKKSRKKNR
jgi:hypothetical protein